MSEKAYTLAWLSHLFLDPLLAKWGWNAAMPTFWHAAPRLTYPVAFFALLLIQAAWPMTCGTMRVNHE